MTTDKKRLSSLTRKLSKRFSRKIVGSADRIATQTDSTPEYDPIHRNSTKLATTRKSLVKQRAMSLKRKAFRNTAQKEKRYAVYDQMRHISKCENVSDQTYSINSLMKFSAATYDVDVKNVSYESEIDNFHAEVNKCQGAVEIIIDNVATNDVDDDEVFERLCNAKESQCPFEDKEKIGEALAPYAARDSKQQTQLIGDIDSNVGAQFINSNSSAIHSTRRISSHCARMYWNQQKIPQIETFRAEKKSFNSESRHSSQSNQSTHTLYTTIKSFHASVAVGWTDLPPFVKFYMIAITIAFISILYNQLFH